MIRLVSESSLYVATLAAAGPVRERDARVLRRRLDLIGRTRGHAAVLLDLTGAEGEPPPCELRPLAVPGAVVRVAVLGAPRWTAWASRTLGPALRSPVRPFGSGRRADAVRYLWAPHAAASGGEAQPVGEGLQAPAA